MIFVVEDVVDFIVEEVLISYDFIVGEVLSYCQSTGMKNVPLTTMTTSFLFWLKEEHFFIYQPWKQL